MGNKRLNYEIVDDSWSPAGSDSFPAFLVDPMLHLREVLIHCQQPKFPPPLDQLVWLDHQFVGEQPGVLSGQVV